MGILNHKTAEKGKRRERKRKADNDMKRRKTKAYTYHTTVSDTKMNGIILLDFRFINTIKIYFTH